MSGEALCIAELFCNCSALAAEKVISRQLIFSIFLSRYHFLGAVEEMPAMLRAGVVSPAIKYRQGCCASRYIGGLHPHLRLAPGDTYRLQSARANISS
jgi:hypothetical protein